MIVECPDCNNSTSKRCAKHTPQVTATNFSFGGFSLMSRGWECPKCGRVFSPTTSMCFYCPAPPAVYTTNTLSLGDVDTEQNAANKPNKK